MAILPEPAVIGVNTRTGWPDACILLLGGTASFICHSYLSVAACKTSTIYPKITWPPRWPSGKGVLRYSGRSGVRIPFATGFFSGWSHYSDVLTGTQRVNAGTGRPGVSILWLGEVESWICNFYLSVAARAIAWTDQSLRYTSMLLGR